MSTLPHKKISYSCHKGIHLEGKKKWQNGSKICIFSSSLFTCSLVYSFAVIYTFEGLIDDCIYYVGCSWYSLVSETVLSVSYAEVCLMYHLIMLYIFLVIHCEILTRLSSSASVNVCQTHFPLWMIGIPFKHWYCLCSHYTVSLFYGCGEECVIVVWESRFCNMFHLRLWK